MQPAVTTPRASAEALERARGALVEHPACFWTRAPHARLETREDVARVVRRLRQHGSVSAWRTAAEIERCL